MPRSRSPKSIPLTIRLSAEEKAAFDRAAAIAGIQLASWVRERLRIASLRELDVVGELAPFLNAPVKEKPNGK